MAKVPESCEVTLHHLHTEISKLERESLKRFYAENMNRWTRCGELDEFWTALRSHASVDSEWIAEWQERSMSIMKGEPRGFCSPLSPKEST